MRQVRTQNHGRSLADVDSVDDVVVQTDQDHSRLDHDNLAAKPPRPEITQRQTSGGSNVTLSPAAIAVGVIFLLSMLRLSLAGLYRSLTTSTRQRVG